MRISQHLRTILGAALLLAAASAAAQYVWLDEKGKRTYSDRPPPPGVPAERILKAPKGMQQIMAVAATPADAASAAGPSPLAQREADYQKRRKEGAEQVQKAQADTERAAEQKRNCDSAAKAKAQLESGTRLRSQNSADPHEMMGDAERTAELARTNKVIASCR